MSFNYAGKTEAGLKRAINEDWTNGFIINNTLFLVVADGFGISDDSEGIPSGRLVVEEIKKFLEKFYVMNSKEFLKYSLDQAIYTANKLIRHYQTSNKNLYSKYGCSLTICGILPTKEMLVSHMGITRLYIIRDGSIFCGTEDHNEAYTLMKQGLITEEEYELHERRQILNNGLGFKEDYTCFEINVSLQSNDFVLLVTDGVYRLLGEERMKNLIYEAGELNLACEWLIDGSLEVGGIDNLSAIVSLIK